MVWASLLCVLGVLCGEGLFLRFPHDHLCGAEQAVMQHVASLEILQDESILARGNRDQLDGFMLQRVEWLALGLDRSHAGFRQRGVQLAQDQLHARGDLRSAGRGILSRSLQGAFEIIEPREQLTDQVSGG
jgi:hypothetical protein